MTSRTKEPLFGAGVGTQSTGTIGLEEIPMMPITTKTALSSTQTAHTAGSGMTDRVTPRSVLSVKKISIRI